MNNNHDKMTDLLQAYCREFSNWSLYLGIPKYDLHLAHYLKKTSVKLHICIDFPDEDTEIYVPLTYYSTVGEHQFQFPAHERNVRTKIYNELTPERFHELALHMAASRPVVSLDQDAATGFPRVNSSQDFPNEHPSASPSLPLSNILECSSTSPEVPLAIFYIQKYRANKQVNDREAVGQWFRRYLQLLQYQPLDSLLKVDDSGFPIAITKINTATDPTNAPFCLQEWIQSVLITHVFKLIGIIGKHRLHDEDQLIHMAYQIYHDRVKYDEDPIAIFLITQRHFNIKSHFKTKSNNDCRIPNVLHETFWDASLFQPKSLEPLFSKTYAKEQVTVSIRPFDLDRDLEMVHRWFHRDHAKAIWQMNWDLSKLEQFYRCLLANKWGHAYIGEINGIPTFNMEIYWATRDIVGNYFDVLPTDYGTHLFIAPTDKQKKFPSLTMQSIVSWLFDNPKVGRLVGEGAVESMAALMNKVHVGFKLQGIIEMPHKKAHLNFCYREWYWEKFPQNKPLELEQELY